MRIIRGLCKNSSYGLLLYEESADIPETRKCPTFTYLFVTEVDYVLQKTIATLRDIRWGFFRRLENSDYADAG